MTVLYVIIGIFGFLWIVFPIIYFVIGLVGRKTIDEKELIQIILLTKSSRTSRIYKNLLKAMYPISYRKRIAKCLNIKFKGDDE
ncbi:hypothetical protein ACX1NB_02770 [Mycoplasma sp. HF14]